jgi:hypothetical protein
MIGLLKQCIKFAVLFIAAMLCQIFATSTLMSLTYMIHLDRLILLLLLAFGTTSIAAALVIGVLGAYWLDKRPRTGYILSFLLAILWSGLIIGSERPLQFDLLTLSKFCEIPIVTVAGGLTYTIVHRFKTRARKVTDTNMCS